MTVQSGAFSKKGWGDNIWGESLAEFLGTFVLIAFGDGVVAMAVAALDSSGRAATSTTIFQASGDWLLITWGWAFAVAMGVYVAGGVTGAHINPAVTLAFAVKGDFPWNKVIPYWIAQFLGAFAGAWLVYINYSDAISAYEKAAGIVRGTLGGAADSTATYSIFATFPAGYYNGSVVGPFIDQVIGTFFLLLFVFAIVDKLNLPPAANLAPFMIGIAVAAIGMSFGANAGYAINPARDFGPRLFAFFAGWGQVALPGVDNYFWVPIIGPLVGAVIAAFVYHHGIHRVLIARSEANEPPPEAGRVPEG
ncbi:MAG TPA: MIP/aquaporin family protein [Candidatus Limnocylindrales bacterium]|nr:MIP/aquaporin family protein [Candidatus Limnocylindrales bacterium]